MHSRASVCMMQNRFNLLFLEVCALPPDGGAMDVLDIVLCFVFFLRPMK